MGSLKDGNGRPEVHVEMVLHEKKHITEGCKGILTSLLRGHVLQHLPGLSAY